MDRLFAAALCALVLAGCVSSGTKITPDQVAEFERGKATLAEVIGRLGPPNSRTNTPTGQTIIVYAFVAASPGAATSSTATFTFDDSGVLLSSGSSETNTASGRR
jgi:hypothetical protein